MKLDDDLGFVYIAEETSPEDNQVKNLDVHDKNGIFYVEFESALHSFDVMNRNSRCYLAENIMKCLNTERIHSYLAHGGWYGEMNHPISKYKDKPLSSDRIQDIDMGNTSHRMLNPHQVGNLLVSTIQTDAGTEAGMNLAKKMVQGFIPGFSCRAIAGMKLINGKPTVIARKIITYDWVLYQSHREAEQQKNVPNKFISKVPNTVNAVVESVKDTIIPLKEIFESVGRKDVNAQLIMESFDLTADDMIGFTPDRKQVMIQSDNNTIYCNMSPDTKKSVNDFFASF